MAGLYVNSMANTLVAMHQLRRTTARIDNTMTQLATGLRINSARDDPAGLVTRDLLRAEITATNSAIRNTQMANSMLNVAETGLKEISDLLDKAKVLVLEAANDDMKIAANQERIDEILKSINRISSTTKWLGKPLLDGLFSSDNGGATFQIGTQVVSNQRVTVPLESTKTYNIGISEKDVDDKDKIVFPLYLLGSGRKAALERGDLTLADNILTAAISQIATQRGAIGATQKYTLDTTISSLENSLVQLSIAESQISNIDIALASANLARDQILLQSGLRALGLANQNAAYAASLFVPSLFV